MPEWRLHTPPATPALPSVEQSNVFSSFISLQGAKYTHLPKWAQGVDHPKAHFLGKL
jgi:hypothetical protein